jgi:hypothetical protein
MVNRPHGTHALVRLALILHQRAEKTRPGRKFAASMYVCPYVECSRQAGSSQRISSVIPVSFARGVGGRRALSISEKKKGARETQKLLSLSVSLARPSSG